MGWWSRLFPPLPPAPPPLRYLARVKFKVGFYRGYTGHVVKVGERAIRGALPSAMHIPMETIYLVKLDSAPGGPVVNTPEVWVARGEVELVA